MPNKARRNIVENNTNNNLVRATLFVMEVDGVEVPTAKVGSLIQQREVPKVSAAVDALGFYYAETKFEEPSDQIDKALPFDVPVFVVGKYSYSDRIFVYVHEGSDMVEEEDKKLWQGYLKEVTLPWSVYDTLPYLP